MQLKLENLPKSIELSCENGRPVFHYVDERLLPGKLCIAATSDWREVVRAIKSLAVRGAPAIGISGVAALALWAASATSLDDLTAVAEEIATARPTAVNLRWGIERALDAIAQSVPSPSAPEAATVANTANAAGVADAVDAANAAYAPNIADAANADSTANAAGVANAANAAGVAGVADVNDTARLLYALVQDMQAEDERTNRAIGAHGAALLPEGARVLTHCNAGSLATYFYGTALGIVYAAAEQGKIERVYADETRPVGQGARLTTWELAQAGIPVTLICDNMAASLMAQHQVDAVVVGADRIARNGDTANKIGTYGVAVLAHEHGIPFYVAAPTSTIDPQLADGSGITIEQRDPSEVLPDPIPGVEVWNPAFDVTPARYITKIITENGVFAPDALPIGQ